MKKVFLITFTIFIVLLCSCEKNSSTQQNIQKIADTDTVTTLDEKFYEAKQIVYSLPSPQEISIILLEDKNISFNPALLDNLQNVDNYNSELSLALNMGVIIADITYAAMFKENDQVFNYMDAAQKIADQLGLLNYFTQQDVDKIKQNFTDRDQVMNIITKAYMRADAKLQEDHRDNIGALILIGGWIEGLYLAVNTINCNVQNNPKVVNSIAEQQLSLSLLVDFLHYYSNDKLLSQISKNIYQLDKIFQNVHTTIDKNGNIIIDKNDFKRICAKVDSIRNGYLNLY